MNKKKEIVPKLRFPEFGTSEGWKKYKLRELADRITQKVGDNKLVTLSISAGIGFVSQTEKFSRDISGKQYCNYIYLKKGEFSYNKGNSKTFPQGCIYELKGYDEAAVPNAFISFRFKENLVPSFYQGYFDSNFHGKQLVRFITSGARSDGLLNISPTDFFSIVLPTPVKKEEQQKIADCLSSIDKLIDAENRKLKALEKYKKGLMQKLFPAEGKTLPEWRFPEFQECGAWKNRKLLEIGCFIRGVSYSSNDTTNDRSKLLVIRSNNIIPMKDINYRDDLQYVNKNCKEEQQLITGDIAICMANGSKNLVGKASYYDGNYTGNITVGAFCGVFRSQLIITKYLFQTDLYKKMLNTILNGGNGSIANLKAEDILNLSFSIPNNEKEQQKIADCLSEIDTMIKEQSNKVEQLKAHKKGLMQGLFPFLEEADV